LANFTQINREFRLPFFMFQVVAVKNQSLDSEGYEATAQAARRQSVTSRNIVDGKLYTRTEVETFGFKTRPNAISYQDKAGSSFLVRRSGFHSDESGIIGTTVSIKGVSGVEPRRVGPKMLDGWARLKAFRDRIFRLSHTIDPTEQARLLYNVDNPDTVLKYDRARLVIGRDVKYVVNWYDFWNDRAGVVDIMTFADSSSAKSVYNQRYNITLRFLDDEVMKVNTWDGTLKALQTLDWLQNKAASYLGIANTWLENEGFMNFYMGFEIGVGSIEIANAAFDDAMTMIPSLVGTLRGNAWNIPIDSGKNTLRALRRMDLSKLL